MNHRIEAKPAFQLTGIPLRTSTKGGQNHREIAALWQRSMQDGTFTQLQALVPAGSVIGVAGVSTEFDPATEAFTYFIAIETPHDRTALPDGCRDIRIPAATWGIFDAHGPLPTSIPELMPRIFNEWLPTATWEHTDGPILEIYPAGDPQSPNYRCEVWLPLQKSAR